VIEKADQIKHGFLIIETCYSAGGTKIDLLLGLQHVAKPMDDLSLVAKGRSGDRSTTITHTPRRLKLQNLKSGQQS